MRPASFGDNVELLADGGVIRITGVRKSNEGMYQCVASNLAGEVSAVAHLLVIIPPKLQINPAGSIQIKSGERIQLTCQGSGEPVPELVWSKASGRM